MSAWAASTTEMLLEKEGWVICQESKVIIKRGVVIHLPFSQPIVCRLRSSGTFLFRNQQRTVTSQSSLNGLSNKPTALLTNALKESCLNSDRYISVSVHLFSSTLNKNRALLFTLNGTKFSVIVVTARVEVDDHSAVFSEWQFTIKND